MKRCALIRKFGRNVWCSVQFIVKPIPPRSNIVNWTMLITNKRVNKGVVKDISIIGKNAKKRKILSINRMRV